MCNECDYRTEVTWSLQLSKRIDSAMSVSCTDNYNPYQGTRAYVTLDRTAQLLDVSYHVRQPHNSDLLSFAVHDIEHLRNVVFQIMKMGYRRLYWTNSEEVEKMCPLPPAGLERLNYYLASLGYWEHGCKTYQYLYSEICSLIERGPISPDFSVVRLLEKIQIDGD
ncbi:hypothetical protein [Vibrio owensii]|uniref:hypothetical protein n=1 Tax=Vibrio owensii TaxID=696485 RepID=UPI00126A0B0D|nr:hypothetical protein [Vibrio owensii]